MKENQRRCRLFLDPQILNISDSRVLALLFCYYNFAFRIPK